MAADLGHFVLVIFLHVVLRLHVVLAFVPFPTNHRLADVLREVIAALNSSLRLLYGNYRLDATGNLVQKPNQVLYLHL